MRVPLLANAMLTAATIVAVWGAVYTHGEPEPRVVQFNTVEPAAPNYVEAERQVQQRATDLTEGRVCYEDPTGHQPTFAVVKDDGGTSVYRLTADQAWSASHAGKVWILAWCD